MAIDNSQLHHQITFDFPIKSIIPGEDPSLLLIETANVDQKQQTFLLLSLDQLEIVQAMAFGEDYSGLVVKSYDMERLLLVQYSNQNNPDLTNIFTFEWHGGEPTFSLQNTRIIKSGPDWIRVPHPHFVNKEVVIDLKTAQQTDFEPTQQNDEPLTAISYTRTYPETSEYFNWFEQYFSKHDIVPYKQIEYLKVDQRILISFYEQQENGLKHQLAILDDKGQMMECLLLDEQLDGIGRDNFFVLRNKAIFVTNKKILNIYEL